MEIINLNYFKYKGFHFNLNLCVYLDLLESYFQQTSTPKEFQTTLK
jgi:hypothetical protein